MIGFKKDNASRWKKRIQIVVLCAMLYILNTWNLQVYAAPAFGPGMSETAQESASGTIQDAESGSVPDIAPDTNPEVEIGEAATMEMVTTETAATETAADENLSVTPVAPDSYLGGARLTMLANQSESQMMSVIFETSSGNLIVIDGGTEADADHLLSTIQAKGGHVSAWLITHPHSDHVGAITALLNRGADITIDQIYYNLTSIEWYQTYEAYRADMVVQFAAALGTLPPETLRSDVKRGDTIIVDDVTIRVLNSPYLIETNSINNSSVAYQLQVNGKSIVFLGDLGVEAGALLMADYADQRISCDILQMAHHGQFGVSEEVYQALDPEICLWPTPNWLWDNDGGQGYNSGPWLTLETRSWMEKLGVTANYCIKDGDQVIE